MPVGRLHAVRRLAKFDPPALLGGNELGRVMAVRSEAGVPPDADLIARMARGDERALGALYDRYGPTAYRLALAVVAEPADAEEVVSDAFGQLWRTAASFDAGRGTVYAWVTTVVRSRALDRVRARKRHARVLERSALLSPDGVAAPLGSLGANPAGGAEQGETRGLVLRSLAALPDAQRRVIELAYFGGLSHSEIAAELGEPLGTVKTRMRSALEKLRSALAPLLLEGES